MKDCIVEILLPFLLGGSDENFVDVYVWRLGKGVCDRIGNILINYG
ncbi:hypothetical protein [Chroococcidiopsis cubana]|nr:hypothetical protein [Chroococcidiopsis cubana]